MENAQSVSTEETTHSTIHVQPHKITKIKNHNDLENSCNGLENLTATIAAAVA